jgi:hypothetical protein
MLLRLWMMRHKKKWLPPPLMAHDELEEPELAWAWALALEPCQ